MNSPTANSNVSDISALFCSYKGQSRDRESSLEDGEYKSPTDTISTELYLRQKLIESYNKRKRKSETVEDEDDDQEIAKYSKVELHEELDSSYSSFLNVRCRFDSVNSQSDDEEQQEERVEINDEGIKDVPLSANNSEEKLVSVDDSDQRPLYYPAVQGCRYLNNFDLLNRIEEGAFGEVFRARDRQTAEIVALKRLKMENEKYGFPITSLREVNTLMKAQHENIVRVREVVFGSNLDSIFLVMDFVEHDLKSFLKVINRPLEIAEVKCLMVQLLAAVAHLHDNWIIHRDLKTSNLLLSHSGVLKVADFGLAREYGSPLKAYTNLVVTLWYRAPELLLGQKEYSTPIDVWSVGCIFGELLISRPLFAGKSEPEQIAIIFRELGIPTDETWQGVMELPLMKKIKFKVNDKPRNDKRLANRLSSGGKYVFGKLLSMDPTKRFSAKEARDHFYFSETPLPLSPAQFPKYPAKSETIVQKNPAMPPKRLFTS